MNNGNCVTNNCGLGNNSMWLILIVLLFMPNLFGGCGNCNGFSDLFGIIILLFFFMGGSGNLFGNGCGC